MGGTLSASSEPGRTILRVAGQLEGLPHRFGAHPSAYTVSFYGPGALSWLPAHWVSADRPGRGRFGAPRHLAVTGQPHQGGGELAHPGAVPPNEQSIGLLSVDETDGDGGLLGDLAGSGSGPVLVAAWDKVDLESLGVARLDISTSASMPTAASLALTGPSADDVVQAAWRLIEAADTRCIGQVESPGFQALLRRVRETSREGPSARRRSPQSTSWRSFWRSGGPARPVRAA